MPTLLPIPTKNPGDVLTSTLWNSYLRDNLNKVLSLGHRTLTVAQFTALTGPEGTKGTVAGDEVYLEVDATNGVIWHLVYESTEATYHWRFLGGPPLVSEVTAPEATASAAYAALTTAGPSVALPRAGDYDVETGAQIQIGTGGTSYMSYDIGGTGAVDADAVLNSLANSRPSCMRPRRKTGLATSTLTAKYKNDASASTTFVNRFMTVKPVRIRHDA